MNYSLLYNFTRNSKTITIYLGDNDLIYAATNNETPELVTPGSLSNEPLNGEAERMIATGVQRKHVELLIEQCGEGVGHE